MSCSNRDHCLSLWCLSFDGDDALALILPISSGMGACGGSERLAVTAGKYGEDMLLEFKMGRGRAVDAGDAARVVDDDVEEVLRVRWSIEVIGSGEPTILLKFEFSSRRRWRASEPSE